MSVEDKCSFCGRISQIKYTSKETGSVCIHCESTDKDMWAGLKVGRRAFKDRKIAKAHRVAEEMGVSHRLEFVNAGTCLLDGKVYFYIQKQKARVKGTPKYYQMRGFRHFVEVFGQTERIR